MLSPLKTSIKQVTFTLENSLVYSFDVKAVITFHYLKKMIASAAQLPKNTFKIINIDHDYTDMDDEILEEYFPNDQSIHFTVIIPQAQLIPQAHESLIKLHLKMNCPLHSNKYLSYYCYKCNKSICSLCVQSIEHNNHQMIEKCDYLQSSKHLIDTIFHDILSQTDISKISFSSKAECFQTTLKKVFFPSLHSLLNDIEMKYNSLVNLFIEKSQQVASIVYKNNQLIKKNCSSSLESFKEEIRIERIMAEEEIFLAFDSKVKELSSFNATFASNYQMFIEFNDQFKSIQQFCEKFYSNILNVLENQLKAKTAIEIEDNINQSSSKLISYNVVNQMASEDTMTSNNIFKPINKTNELIMTSLVSGDKKIQVNFPMFTGISCFLEKAAHCNLNNKLYVSGGILPNKEISQLFYKYDYDSKSIIVMPKMQLPRYNHSLIAKDGIIYSVGGYETSSSEVFSLSNTRWKKTDLMVKERQRPMLAFHNSFLFAFGGFSSKGYEPTIEKISIKNYLTKWEIVPFVNSSENELRLCCSGLALSYNKLYFFGGMNEKGILNSIHCYDFTESTFTLNEQINEQMYFVENTLFLRHNDYYCNIEDKNNNIINVKINN